MLFTEHDFLDRFDAAARAGFRGVEYLGPYDHPAETVAAPDTSQVHGRVGEAPASAGNVVAHHPCKARESIPYAGDGLCGATLDCTDA